MEARNMHSANTDPRLANWPLMDNYWVTVTVFVSYLLFVKFIGPAYMKNKEPYNLRKVLIFYNFSVMTYNAWMFYKFGKHGWFSKYRWICEPLTFSADEDSMGMVQVSWHYFFSRFIEMFDTIFFVLKKKDSQLTNLHIAHHSVMPLGVRIAMMRGACGYNTFAPFLNTFLHIWVYLYNGLTTLGPTMRKYLWWKKFLKPLELIQFCCILVAMTINCLLPSCKVDYVVISWQIGVPGLLLILYIISTSSFYQQDRKRRKTSRIVTFESTNKSTSSPVECNGTSSSFKHVIGND